MPIDLELPAAQVDLGAAAYANLRKNLQANIVKAHGRKHQRHMFLEFTGTAAAVKAWIRTQVAPRVTTAEIQHQHSLARAANPAFDGGLVTGFFLSASGYRKLKLSTDAFASKAFRKGMKDEGGDEKDPDSATWEAGYQGVVHAMVSFADSNAAPVDAAVAALKGTLLNVAKLLTVALGRSLKTADGVEREHFGYADGISNPRFERGGTTSVLADPSWDDGAPLSLALAADPFATATPDAFGSYLVYRKLGQDVGTFDNRVIQLAASLAIPPDLAGATVVGRFKDGTPVVNSKVATGPTLENGFDYDPESEKFKCPAHAHIRKANPRGTTPLTSLEGERKRRIVRRGIPYGKPVFPIADGGFQDPSLTAERGLLFMCFQRNIEKQFAFIQRTWVDNPSFPKLFKGTGDDPLIGQDRDEGQDWPKVWGNPNGGRKKFNFESPVRLEGGEYFFAPSKVFLDTL